MNWKDQPLKETEEQIQQDFKEMMMRNIYRAIKVIPLKSCHAKYEKNKGLLNDMR